MPTDYIPTADPDFNQWQARFMQFAAANAAALGISPAQVAALQTLAAQWDADYRAQQAALAASKAATATKRETRAAFEKAMRGSANLIQALPDIPDTHRIALGLTVRGRHAAAPMSADSFPVVDIEPAGRMRQMVHWHDSATAHSVAIPEGVDHVELWLCIGDDAPSAPKAGYDFIAVDRKPPYLYEFEFADVGKKATWCLRWVSNKGAPGPWSQNVSATIAG